MFKFKTHYWDNESVVLAVLHVLMGTAYYSLFRGVKTYFIDYLLAKGTELESTELAVKELLDLYQKLNWQCTTSLQITLGCLFFSIFPFKLISIHNIYYSWHHIVNVIGLLRSYLYHSNDVENTPTCFKHVLRVRDNWTDRNRLSLILFLLGHVLSCITLFAYFLCLLISVRSHFKRRYRVTERGAMK